jgi:hypothetical protein
MQTRHEETELLAYYLWQERGCPLGTPEVDWYQAERQIEERERSRVAEPVAESVGEPLLIAAARRIGSAIARSVLASGAHHL